MIKDEGFKLVKIQIRLSPSDLPVFGAWHNYFFGFSGRPTATVLGCKHSVKTASED
jgi:hypothetical protein